MGRLLHSCKTACGALAPLVAACSANGPPPSAARDSAPPPLGDDAASQTIGPYDKRIQYVGRIDPSDPAGPWAIQSATTVTVAFRGVTAAVEMNDETVNAGESDFFDVLLDGRPPFVVTPAAPAAWVSLAPLDDAGAPIALAAGAHTLTLVKRTEATVGEVQFLGFQFDEVVPPAPDAAPTRRIEIVGDSIACGYGVEAASANDPECNANGLGQGGYGQGLEDAYASFGVVAARALNAQWHVTCESGVGIVRNTDNGYIDPRPMPAIYPLLHPDDPTNATRWPVTQWAANGSTVVTATPDVVILELGGNDLSLTIADGGMRPPIAVGSPSDPPDAGPTLVGGFIPFVGQLAADYPNAAIVLVANAPPLQEAMEAVVAAYGDGGVEADAGLHVAGYLANLPYPGGVAPGIRTLRNKPRPARSWQASSRE